MSQPRRLFIHVGLQKTGTSYLQGALRADLRVLGEQGVDLVPATTGESFALMLVLRERYDPTRDPASVAGALDRFERALAQAPHRHALLSQESLAAASPEQARRLLSACDGREVHVIVTVRDLARMLPSSWQQELKAGRDVGYRRYLRRLRRSQQAGRVSHPWIQLDAAAVVARWSAVVPPERIHVVTVPPRGGSPTLLLERFCRVLGVDAEQLQAGAEASNSSLGHAQAELLRRVNGALPQEVRRRQVYGDVGKRFFAAQVLAGQDGRRILVPEEFRAWCEATADAQGIALSSSGCQIEGSLHDLRCRAESFEGGATAPDEQEVAAVAVTALADMLVRRSKAASAKRGVSARAAATARSRTPSRVATVRAVRHRLVRARAALRRWRA